MGDHDPVASAVGEPGAARAGGGVEASGIVDRRQLQLIRPGAHVAVGRHHERSEPTGGVDDLFGEPAAEDGALVGIELLGETRLAQRECADRDHDAGSAHRHQPKLPTWTRRRRFR